MPEHKAEKVFLLFLFCNLSKKQKWELKMKITWQGHKSLQVELLRICPSMEILISTF